jgi:hypothetical protein
VGISTLQQLEKLGWEKALRKLVREFPEALNLNFASAMIGALEGEDWREIDPEKKARARQLIRELREELEL